MFHRTDGIVPPLVQTKARNPDGQEGKARQRKTTRWRQEHCNNATTAVLLKDDKLKTTAVSVRGADDIKEGRAHRSGDRMELRRQR